MEHYKLAAIGERESVLALSAVGVETFFSDSPEEAEKLLRRLIKSGEYAAIFLTEQLLVSLSATVAEFHDLPLPAVIAIPGVTGPMGIGVENIKKSVERAVGADILFKEQE